MLYNTVIDFCIPLDRRLEWPQSHYECGGEEKNPTPAKTDLSEYG
jgi:hypothetical protein